ncbi:MAG: hypothetical protein K0S65_484 [Labilithrix sp.]|nr:hypothetical protein [Labilithrix sp.]
MGSERLSLLSHLALLLALALSTTACGSAATSRGRESNAPPPTRHVQIVHAMTTPQRDALVDRLRERNPTPPSSPWEVNSEAIGRSLTVVDPFAGFLRRARRRESARPPRTEGPIPEAEAADRARAFVKRNADLFGLPRYVVPGLAEHARAVSPSDHAAPRATWCVRFEAPFASKGYEGFKEIDNVADLEVFVDDDGEVSSFVNLSRIHPHLAIDIHPGLAQEDPRVIAKLLGRKVFALDAREALAGDTLHALQGLRRIPLGEVRAENVTHMQLVIHLSTGPQLAWLVYRLGYFVEIAKPAPPAMGDELYGAGTAPPQFFFFRYVVDADTGDVIEDARAPLSPPLTEPPP